MEIDGNSIDDASVPTSLQVLGAKIHGDFDRVLEFLSLETKSNNLLSLQANDILIKVSYTDVNPVDIQKLRGRESDVGCPVENQPHVPGYGGSGVVIQVGSAIGDGWIGQAVCFLADPTRMGSYASYIVVDANCVAQLPSAKPAIESSSRPMMRDCASIPVAGLTAYESLAKCGLLTTSGNDGIGGSPQKSLLIVGASGGVGSWTIILARALNPKLKIIATASTEVQQKWCKDLGADQVILHDEIAAKLEGGRNGSVDAVVCLTEPTQELFGRLSEVIQPFGTICLVVAGKSIGSLNLGFCFFKCVDVKTETVFSSIRTNYKNVVPASELKFIVDLMANGKIKAPLSPDLESGNVSESIQHSIGENGVLKALSQTTGRRGNLVMKIDW